MGDFKGIGQWHRQAVDAREEAVSEGVPEQVSEEPVTEDGKTP